MGVISINNTNEATESPQVVVEDELNLNPRDLLRMHDGCPWKWHFIMMAPLCVYLIVSGMIHGFFGDVPRDLYRELSAYYPTVTHIMRIASGNAEKSLYAVYVLIAIRALIFRDKWELRFVIRFIIFAIIFSVIVTHFLKFTTGIPRPHFDWPPRPLQFARGYDAFPSGHAIAIITAGLPLALWFGKKSVTALIFFIVTTVCIARIWLGAHHPIDVVGSVPVGAWAARCIFQPHQPPVKSENNAPPG